MSPVRYIHISLELWGGLFCLVAAISASIIEGKDGHRGKKVVYLLIATMVLLLSDSAAWMSRGMKGIAGFYIVRISNFLVFETSYVISMIFMAYVTDYLEENGKVDRSWSRLNYLVGHVGMALVLLSQFNHMFYYFDADNYYHRASLYWISLALGFLQIILYGSVLARYRNRLKGKEQILLGLYVILPAIAITLQYAIYGIALLNIAITIAALVLFNSYLTERSLFLAEQERRMGEMQIQLVLSQIQPHFIYNALNSIYYLCEKDPKTAQMATNWFAEYLRSNMDSMKRNTPVTFETELHALDNYLKLEKMRFAEELQIEFDIRAKNFMLPPMTLQPIVENAVKHGLGPKDGGGTVRITSSERDHEYEIVISDDGVGYDPGKNAGDGRTHTGIENVKKRLWFMCKGTIEISGKSGEGTTVVIHIPKELKRNGDSGGR